MESCRTKKAVGICVRKSPNANPLSLSPFPLDHMSATFRSLHRITQSEEAKIEDSRYRYTAPLVQSLILRRPRSLILSFYISHSLSLSSPNMVAYNPALPLPHRQVVYGWVVSFFLWLRLSIRFHLFCSSLLLVIHSFSRNGKAAYVCYPSSSSGRVCVHAEILALLSSVILNMIHGKLTEWIAKVAMRGYTIAWDFCRWTDTNTKTIKWRCALLTMIGKHLTSSYEQDQRRWARSSSSSLLVSALLTMSKISLMVHRRWLRRQQRRLSSQVKCGCLARLLFRLRPIYASL